MKRIIPMIAILFIATICKAQSYSDFIKHFPRKSSTVVRDYKGNVLKTKSLGVLDISVSELQQCADAAIRLRAEYLYKEKMYSQIQFKLTSGLNVPFEKWANGWRVKVSGNSARLVKSRNETNNYSRQNFDAYLQVIMMYAGSASLDRDLKIRNGETPQVGDMLILGGFPGHVVIIVDEMVKDGIHYYKFAQSWIPAQDIEIVLGYNNLKPNYGNWTPIIKNAGTDQEITVSGYRFSVYKHLKHF